MNSTALLTSSLAWTRKRTSLAVSPNCSSQARARRREVKKRCCENSCADEQYAKKELGFWAANSRIANLQPTALICTNFFPSCEVSINVSGSLASIYAHLWALASHQGDDACLCDDESMKWFDGRQFYAYNMHYGKKGKAMADSY